MGCLWGNHEGQSRYPSRGVLGGGGLSVKFILVSDYLKGMTEGA